MKFNDILLFIYNHFGAIVFWIFVLIHRKELWESLFLQPIRGGNGVTQNDELAKYTLIVCLVYMVWIEGKDTGSYYEPSVFYAVVLGVMSLAGVKYIGEAIRGLGNKKDGDDNQGH